MDQDTRAQYAAFISYRHLAQDRQWAKWLLNELESFRTPSSLVKLGYPARIGRIYRDEDENPASSDLHHQVDRALNGSRNLIVVASEDTPQSQWIEREVARFKELGREDRILLLLISGTPATSFPKALLEIPDQEPLALDVRPRPDEPEKVVKRRAILRLAAAIIGCSFDDLYQRDRRRTGRRLVSLAAAAAGAALVVGAGLFVAAQQREAGRLEQVVYDLNQDFNQTEYAKALQTVRSLSRSGWPFIKLPDSVRAAVEPLAARLAIKEISPASEGAWPVVVAPWREEGAAVGLSDGNVQLVENGIIRPLTRGVHCTGEDAAFSRCAVTALAVSGEAVAAGDRKGRVTFTDPRQQLVFVQLGQEAVSSLVWRSRDSIIAADDAGRLYSIKLDQYPTEVRLISAYGRGIARLLRDDDGSIIVVRRTGGLQRLSANNALRPVGHAGRIIKDAAFLDSGLAMLRFPPDQGGWEDRGGNSGLTQFLFGTPSKPATKVEAVNALDLGDMHAQGVVFNDSEPRLVLGAGYKLRFFDLPDSEPTRVAIMDLKEARTPKQLIGMNAHKPRGFYPPGAIALSRDKSHLYTLSASGPYIVRIDLRRLKMTRRILEHSRRPLAELCALGLAYAAQDVGDGAELCR